MLRATIISLTSVAAFATSARSAALMVPFDFARGAVGIDVIIAGAPLYVLLDTGVDPSVIDLTRGKTLQLRIDRAGGGEADGFGNGKGATVFPAKVTGLVIRGHRFATFEAVASNLAALSDHYGRKLDGVLGYSFLKDKIILLNYQAKTLGILARGSDVTPLVRNCRVRWTAPLRTLNSFPVIPAFRLGGASGPVSLDTGSNGGIGLFRSALDLPGVRAALIRNGTVIHTGARGEAKANSYRLKAPLGFGPFSLPSGENVTLHDGAGPDDGRIANVGNQLFAQMKLQVLLNYRAKTMRFYGGCR